MYSKEIIVHECANTTKYMGSASLTSKSMTKTDSFMIPICKNFTRQFLLFPKDFAILSPESSLDRIDSLLECRKYTEAIHYCQVMKIDRKLEQAANEYACYLWDKEKMFKQAMSVWAEYILPIATSDYWEEFCKRLSQQRKLELIEDYLPFDNKSLLSSNTYYLILENHLVNKDYNAFHERILRWPMVYPVRRIIERVLFEMNQVQECDKLLLLHSLFKLHDFQNDFLGATEYLIQLNPSEALDYLSSKIPLLDDYGDPRKDRIYSKLYSIDPERTRHIFPDEKNSIITCDEDLSSI